jgi:putative spermidine/putrescine transport system ATP-binding protein
MNEIRSDVEIIGAYKKYGHNVVLNGINLEIKQGELLTLLGPSGCGKTTTLNLIAGFLQADQGEVYIKGKNVTNVPPHKRDLGMVFQTYSLFPHMTVYQNLEFGLKLRKIKAEEKDRRINSSLELVRLEGLEKRYPRELSGGQRQRVAIARALVVEPELLLLDEPLSNLDAKLRHELRLEIKRLQKEIGVTTIFVTHDQDEALALSDRVVVMNRGQIEQISTPTEIYKHPKNEFVFQFIGKSNTLQGKIVEVPYSEKIKILLEKGLEIIVDSSNLIGEDRSYKVGDQVKLCIRPEKLIMEPLHHMEHYPNSHVGTITQMNYFGTSWETNVSFLGTSIQILSPNISSDWNLGSEVLVKWDPSDFT